METDGGGSPASFRACVSSRASGGGEGAASGALSAFAGTKAGGSSSSPLSRMRSSSLRSSSQNSWSSSASSERDSSAPPDSSASRGEGSGGAGAASSGAGSSGSSGSSARGSTAGVTAPGASAPPPNSARISSRLKRSTSDMSTPSSSRWVSINGSCWGLLCSCLSVIKKFSFRLRRQRSAPLAQGLVQQHRRTRRPMPSPSLPMTTAAGTRRSASYRGTAPSAAAPNTHRPRFFRFLSRAGILGTRATGR